MLPFSLFPSHDRGLQAPTGMTAYSGDGYWFGHGKEGSFYRIEEEYVDDCRLDVRCMINKLNGSISCDLYIYPDLYSFWELRGKLHGRFIDIEPRPYDAYEKFDSNFEIQSGGDWQLVGDLRDLIEGDFAYPELQGIEWDKSRFSMN